jgi:hypothetical protein
MSTQKYSKVSSDDSRAAGTQFKKEQRSKPSGNNAQMNGANVQAKIDSKTNESDMDSEDLEEAYFNSEDVSFLVFI